MSYSIYPKGSEWRKWDLQTHTILDEDYVPLSKYSDAINKKEPDLWKQYVAKVGGEQNALLYDSKAHFSDGGIKLEERCLNYAVISWHFSKHSIRVSHASG